MMDTEELVIRDIKFRQQAGIQKYGTTVANNPLELKLWITHLYEELLDASIYCKRILQAIEKGDSDELA